MAQGAWVSAFNHPTNGMTGWPATFNGINMAMIPDSNNIVVWDSNGPNQNLGPAASWPQRFAVGNPELNGAAGSFTNYVIPMPPGFGDLFCAGHTWLPDGRLFVAGGNTRYQFGTSTHYEGSQFVGIWDPKAMANGNLGWLVPLWNSQTLPAGGTSKAMHLKRWYPTVILLSRTKVMVAGGVESTDNYYCWAPNPNQALDHAMDTYEVFDLATMDWERDQITTLPKLYNGPSPGPWPNATACDRVLGEYPRMHVVSTNQVVMSGMFPGACQVRHDPAASIQTWLQNVSSGVLRNYGSSVLLPNVGNTPGGRDLVMILGGGYTNPVGVYDTSRIVDGGAGTMQWGATQTMVKPRMCGNAVLLPDGAVVAIGGSEHHFFASIPKAVRVTEIYTKTDLWHADAQQLSPRMYHSTAVLLPSGNVFSAGGDGYRLWDYEIYVPPYFTAGQIVPAYAGTWSGSTALQLNWDTEYVIDHEPLEAGITISRVVLMRPCSVTHHSDFDQRYVELVTVEDGEWMQSAIKVRTPHVPNFAVGAPVQRGLVEAMPGWYMMFLISSQGTPSQAKWVNLP